MAKGIVYSVIFISLLFFSCRQTQEPQPIPEELTKLERLYRIRPDSVMKYYDLSNDSLTEFPDLSRYVITSLDLSHNLLDTIIPERLPLGIEWLNLSHNRLDTIIPERLPLTLEERLDLSHNRLEGELEVKEGSMPVLRELDLSYNKLEGISVRERSLRRLILAHNNLYERVEAYNLLDYLDVSYNEYLHLSKKPFPGKGETDTFLVEGTQIKEEDIPLLLPPPTLRCVFKFTTNEK